MKRFLRALMSTGLMISCFLSFPVYGQEETYELEPTVVEEEAVPKSGVKVEEDKTVIELDKRSTSSREETVMDVLETVPGIDLERGDPANSDRQDAVRIRGFDGTRYEILIDGRPVKNAGGMGFNLVDWNSLSLENVEKIEVLKGSHYAEYPGSMGGYINIITKTGTDRDDMMPEAKAYADYSSYDTQMYGVQAAGNVEDFGYSIAGGYRSSEGYLRNSAYNMWDMALRASYQLPTDGTISAGYKISRQDKELYVMNDEDRPNGAEYDDDWPEVRSGGRSIDYYYSDDHDNRLERTTEYYDVTLEQPSPIGEWRVTWYKNWEDKYQQTFQWGMIAPPPPAPTYGNYENEWDFVVTTYGLIVQDRFTLFEDHDIIIGFDAHDVGVRYRLETPVRTSTGEDLRRIRSRGYYIEDEYQATNKLTIALGARYDYVEMHWTGNKNYLSQWSPKSRWTYRFSPDTTGFVYVSKVFRMPVWQEYNSMGYDTGQYLDKETGMQYEGGINHSINQSLNMKVAYYYYDIENYIAFNQVLNARSAAMAGRLGDAVFNIDRAIVHGGEFEANFDLQDRVSGYVAYTYQDHELVGVPVPDDEFYVDLQELPRHKAYAGIRWDALENTAMLADVRWVDARETKIEDYSGDIETKDIDAFATVDVGVEQSFMQDKIILKGYANNVLDHEYEEKWGVPSPGATYGIRLTVSNF